ncbi:MAG: hypothetical protein ACRCUX_13090 [Beijerinckiaceae bacterium]
MSKPRTPDAAAVKATAAGGGLAMPDTTATRIAGAIAPALKAFDLPDFTLPPAEEPSGWTRAARANAAANTGARK